MMSRTMATIRSNVPSVRSAASGPAQFLPRAPAMFTQQREPILSASDREVLHFCIAAAAVAASRLSGLLQAPTSDDNVGFAGCRRVGSNGAVIHIRSYGARDSPIPCGGDGCRPGIRGVPGS